MNLKDLNIQKVVNEFEKEMFSVTREFEIAEALEFELFNLNEDCIYGLQFNREDLTYSIVLNEFDEDEEQTYSEVEQIYLETYPMYLYNKEFLISRIVSYMNELIIPQNRVN